jgi:hypothetical protein
VKRLCPHEADRLGKADEEFGNGIGGKSKNAMRHQAVARRSNAIKKQ